MHAKLIVVDEAEAVISTGNYSVYQMRQERNFVAHDDDPQDIADLVALFDADWERSPPDLSCTRLLVSPVNARQRILALIRGASRSLLVESMQFADKDVRGAVAARKQAGVEVRVLLADPSWIDANQDAATFLAGQGIEARWLAHLHVKAIVVDGLRAYTGSENLSYTSLSKNREVGLIFADHGAVQPMVDTFEKDWALATPF
jgi:phosphatidylserine/phosphatidylglycerophosphate/cardiolipin synthase-like enzyme